MAAEKQAAFFPASIAENLPGEFVQITERYG